MRSRDVRVFLEWLEYCNAPADLTTWSNERAKNGFREPHKVSFWGVGNESWGCGGDFTPEEYATEFRKFTAWLPTYGVQLKLIGSGPNGGDVGWTRRFFQGLAEKGQRQITKLHGWGLHYYCGSTGQQAARRRDCGTNRVRCAESKLHEIGRAAKRGSGEFVGPKWFGFRERQRVGSYGGESTPQSGARDRDRDSWRSNKIRRGSDAHCQ